MIVPFGQDCNTASALRVLGVRTCAYPFDWISADFDTLVTCFTEIVSSSDNEIETMLDRIFNLDSKNIHIVGWSDKQFLISNGIGFPHDDLSDIRSKYSRRFYRLRDDYIRAEKVTLVIGDLYYERGADIVALLEKLDSKAEIAVVTSFSDILPSPLVRVFITNTTEKDRQGFLTRTSFEYNKREAPGVLTEAFRDLLT
jgi:hypothetical protein